MKTGFISSQSSLNHDTGDGHPEKIDRVTAVIDNFKKLDNKNLIWKKPSKFDHSYVINTHSSEYINQVNHSLFPLKNLIRFDKFSFKSILGIIESIKPLFIKNSAL